MSINFAIEHASSGYEPIMPYIYEPPTLQSRKMLYKLVFKPLVRVRVGNENLYRVSQ